MDEFRRDCGQVDGPYRIALWPSDEWIDLEIELLSARKIPCRYNYASKQLESRLTEREENYFVSPGWIMVDRIPESVDREVVDVARKAISKFLSS